MSAFDPYHKWLGIRLEEQPPHHYRLLGINPFETDLDVIEQAADRQMAHLQTHKTGKYSDLSQRLLNEISSAKICLLNPQKREAYDRDLRAKLAAAKPAPPPPPPRAPPAVAPVAARPVATAAPMAQMAPASTPAAAGTAADTFTPMIQVGRGPRGGRSSQAGPLAAVGGLVLVLALVGFIAYQKLGSGPAVSKGPGSNGPVSPLNSEREVKKTETVVVPKKNTGQPPDPVEPVKVETVRPVPPVKPVEPTTKEPAVISVTQFEPTPLSEEGGWYEIPEFLRGATIYSQNTRNQGELQFQVTRGGLMYVAAAWTSEEATPKGPWLANRMTKEQWIEKGWVEVGTMLRGTKREPHTIFRRVVKAGEQFSLQTKRYIPPLAIVLEPSGGEASPSTGDRSWTRGAVLALSFDDPPRKQDGALKIRDLSGNGNDGLLHGAELVPGKAGSAPHFQSRDDYVECADSPSLNPTEALTVAAWIKGEVWREFPKNYIVSKDDWRDGPHGYVLRAGPGKLNFTVGGPNTWMFANANPVMQLDTWHLAVGTCDGKTLRAFVDGKLQGTGPVTVALLPSKFNLRIGLNTYTNEERCFSGLIDEVAIWNRALSLDEVTSLCDYSSGGKSYCRAIGDAAGVGPAAVATNDPPGSEPPRNLTDLVAPQKKKPVPTEELQKEAKTLIDELFKDEVAKAKKLDEKAALARNMLNQALATNDNDAAQYTLLLESAQWASAGGQVGGAWQALDEVSRRFEADVLPQKEKALDVAAKAAKIPSEFKAVSESWLVLLNEAIAHDQYDAALRFAEDAERFAIKSTDKVLTKLISEGAKEIKELGAAYKKAQPFKATLDTAPDDAEAAAAWGRFQCAYKNDWQNGLATLAKGGDDELAQLAKKDLAQPRDVMAQVALGDSWWDTSVKEKDVLPKKFFRERAAFWYRYAQPSLTGLPKAKVDKRLDEIAAASSVFKPGQWVDVLGMIDTSRHGIKGTWGRQQSAVGILESTSSARVVVPVELTGSYELQLRVTKINGSGLVVVFPVGDRTVLLFVGGSSGLELIEGRFLDSNPTGMKGINLADNKPVNLEFRVEVLSDQAKIAVEMDGRRIVNWQGPRSSLSIPDTWTLPNSKTIALGAHRAGAMYYTARLRVNSGTATLVP